MAAVVPTFAPDLADPIQLHGDVHLVSGTVDTDGGDYAAGGFVVNTLFGVDEVLSVLVGHGDAAGITGRYVQSTGKLFVYDEDNTDGDEAEHAAAAISASFPVIVVGRKAR